MICNALLAAFGKKTTNSTIKMFADIQIEVNGPKHILGDVITLVTVSKLATVSHELGGLEADEMQQVIEVLNNGLSEIAPALAIGMKTATEGKDFLWNSDARILVEKASKRVEATDEFANWENPTAAVRCRAPEIEQPGEGECSAQEGTRSAQGNQAGDQVDKFRSSTSATAAGNTGCFTCGQEGHRADRCPKKPGTPATPRTAGAKSAGQSSKKVGFTKLQLHTAVQEAVKNTVQETVAALAKNGWQKP
jgi:hypothetical protein